MPACPSCKKPVYFGKYVIKYLNSLYLKCKELFFQTKLFCVQYKVKFP